MLKKGCKKRDITVAIGPCIKQKSYNVGKDFQRKFVKKNKKNKIFFKKKKNTIYFDLSNFVKSQLKSIKITKIFKYILSIVTCYLRYAAWFALTFGTRIRARALD